MKCVILAGGLGSRISEESGLRPKPMIEIGGRPLIWHIMKIYAHHGIRDFVICLGYKGYVIKEYFVNYFLHQSDVTIDTGSNQVSYHDGKVDDWRVTLADTGEHSMTGGRIKRVRRHLDPNEPFCLTYGDGVSDVDIARLVAFHRAHGRQATMTAVVPGSKARIEFIEFRGMPRKAFSIRVTDPGSSGMAIRVQKIDELLAQLKGEGLPVSSKNGEMVEWSATIRNVVIMEPNGLNLELVGAAPAAPAVR